MAVFASGSQGPLPAGIAASQEAYDRISELRGATLEVLENYSGLSVDGDSGVADIIVALQSAANELGSAERRILATVPPPAR